MELNLSTPSSQENTINILDSDGQTILSIAADGAVTASKTFRASEAAEQFLDALTDIVAERDNLRRVVYAIGRAWTVPGPVPAYHHKQQINLIRNWPVLVQAVQRAVHIKEQ